MSQKWRDDLGQADPARLCAVDALEPTPSLRCWLLSVALKLFFAARPERLGLPVSLPLSLEVLLAFEEEQIEQLIIWGSLEVPARGEECISLGEGSLGRDCWLPRWLCRRWMSASIDTCQRLPSSWAACASTARRGVAVASSHSCCSAASRPVIVRFLLERNSRVLGLGRGLEGREVVMVSSSPRLPALQ